MSFHHDDGQGAPGARNSALPPAIRDAAAGWIARRDAGLSAGEQAQFDAWQQADPRHRLAVEGLEQVWQSLDRPLATGTADAVLRELEGRAGRRRRRRVASVAAAAVLLLAVGAGWRTMQREPGPEPAQVASAAIRLPQLQPLPDGSVAELREGAEIVVEFGETLRRVVLRRGEAHFKVEKNPNRPFVVVAGGVEVRAVGTAFSVDLGRSAVEVLVTEGRVAVDVAAAASASSGLPESKRILISAGDGAIVHLAPDHDQSRVDALANVDLQARLAWRGPRLEFSGTPLSEAVALMNRHNRVQLVIEDPALARSRVSGIFGAHNTDAFVRLLEVSFKVEPTLRGADTIILRRQP